MKAHRILVKLSHYRGTPRATKPCECTGPAQLETRNEKQACWGKLYRGPQPADIFGTEITYTSHRSPRLSLLWILAVLNKIWPPRGTKDHAHSYSRDQEMLFYGTCVFVTVSTKAYTMPVWSNHHLYTPICHKFILIRPLFQPSLLRWDRIVTEKLFGLNFSCTSTLHVDVILRCPSHAEKPYDWLIPHLGTPTTWLSTI
jgi:hypothetical protein